MNKKGFTLIELIGTIVIISLMVMIIIPTVNRVIKAGQSKADEQLESNIILAARNWATDNRKELPKVDGWSINVSLSKLKEAGYLDQDLKKPSTGENYGNKCVQITNISMTSKQVYQYTLEDSTCNSTIINNVALTLKGKTADNPNLASGTWTNQNVTLYAINENNAALSGSSYSYEWYLNGATSPSKTTKSSENTVKVNPNTYGTYKYKVRMNSGDSITNYSNEYIINIDKKSSKYNR